MREFQRGEFQRVFIIQTIWVIQTHEKVRLPNTVWIIEVGLYLQVNTIYDLIEPAFVWELLVSTMFHRPVQQSSPVITDALIFAWEILTHSRIIISKCLAAKYMTMHNTRIYGPTNLLCFAHGYLWLPGNSYRRKGYTSKIKSTYHAPLDRWGSLNFEEVPEQLTARVRIFRRFSPSFER